MVFRFVKKSHSLLEFGKSYVREHFGEEYVQDFENKYVAINRGMPIGNLEETISFLNLVEEIKNHDSVFSK